MTLSATSELQTPPSEPEGLRTSNPWRRSIAVSCAALLGLLASLVLVGWEWDVPALKSVLPGAVEMKVNTAIALLLATASLSVYCFPVVLRQHRFAQLLGFTVAGIGAATLCEYVTGWNLGIDELLFQDHVGAYSAVPGRMSPYSAAFFIAIGSALVTLPHRKWVPLVLLGVLVTAFIGTLSLLGYLSNARQMTMDQWVSPVATNSALAFVLLAIGTWSTSTAISRRGSGDTFVARGAVENKVLIGFIAALALLYAGGGITYRLGVTFANSAQWVAHTEQVRAQLGALYATISDSETAQRNYLLIGKPTYRARFRDLDADVDTKAEDLRRLIADNPGQLSRLSSLEQLIARRMENLSQHIQIFEQDGLDAARAAIADDDGAAAMESVQAAVKVMDGVEEELLLARSSRLSLARSYTLIALLCTLVTATAGLVILFGSISRDIRERVRLREAAERAQAEAQRATQAKSEFLAAMSHEIRTPMNGVIGMLEVLQQSSLMGDQVEMVSLIRESADSLLTIIDDILDFSKIEAGRLEIESMPMSAAEAIETTSGLLNRLAERKGATLTVFADPAIPATLLGDSVRLRQVLINLTNNAIKFSSGLEHPAQVSLRAVLAERTPDGVVVEFCVTDNGIGMSEATMKKLFSSFAQADASTTRRYGGTGLGLVICQQLAGLMGGSISVATALNKGSVFTVRLPFRLASNTAGTCEPMADIRDLSCLVIGDRAGLADDLATYLTADAAMVARAVDLTAAREWTAAGPPSLVLWVVNAGETQPPMDELVVAMRGVGNIAARTVIVVLGHRGRRVPRAVGDGIILLDGNALTRRELKNAVAIAAGRASTTQEQPSGQHRTTTTSPPTRNQAVLQHRLILVAEDNEINQKVIRQQLTLLGYAVDVVTNGRKALDRWRSGDYSLLLTDLHMPEMDGYALAMSIRKSEGSESHVPIIALTANALSGEAERCLAVGMDDYLSKPAALKDLAAALDKWLPSVKISSAELPRPPAPVDLSALEALVGSDQQIIRELLQDFCALAARSAEELTDACAAQRCDAIVAIGHKFKSAARSVGALKLGDLCAAIEAAGAARDLGPLAGLLPEFSAEMAGVDRYLRSWQARDCASAQCA